MFVLWISDLDSPSYFVASAAVDLGFFAREGVEMKLIDGDGGPQEMKAGRAHFSAGSAFPRRAPFPPGRA